MSIPRIALAGGVAAAVILGLFVLASESPSGRSDTSGREGASGYAVTRKRGENALIASESGNAGDSSSHENANATSELPRAWLPTVLLVPGLGSFSMDFVAWDESGEIDSGSPIRVAPADPPAHFGLRIKPGQGFDAEARPLEAILGQLTLVLTKNLDERLSLRQFGPSRKGTVLESGTPETVHIVPYEILGMRDWQLNARQNVRTCKIVAQIGEDAAFEEGAYAAKDLVILNPLHRPDIGPGAATAELEPEPRGEESEFAQAHVFVSGMKGIRRADLRLYDGDRAMPATIRSLELVMAGEKIEIPSSTLLDGALLSYTAFVKPGWWADRKSLVVEFEVWDDQGKRHLLRWEPKLD